MGNIGHYADQMGRSNLTKNAIVRTLIVLSITNMKEGFSGSAAFQNVERILAKTWLTGQSQLEDLRLPIGKAGPGLQSRSWKSPSPPEHVESR